MADSAYWMKELNIPQKVAEKLHPQQFLSLVDPFMKEFGERLAGCKNMGQAFTIKASISFDNVISIGEEKEESEKKDGERV